MTHSLIRHLGFWALVFYGVGDILGAGIYALVGKVIGTAGAGAWLSFVFAAVLAVITGLSYAELSSRFPVAAGAAAFIKRAFGNKLLGTLSGVLVLATGLTSVATVTKAFSGYMTEWLPLPWLLPQLTQILFVLVLSFLSFWGMKESSRVNIVLTMVEVSGLVAVIAAGIGLATSENLLALPSLPMNYSDLGPILSGVTIAFYAYIGFEDLCNLADEAKNPSRDLPRAILLAIVITSALYLIVTVILQMTIPEASIASSDVPLLLVFERGGHSWVREWFSLVAMMAIANTGLANLIMASRLMYGMAREGLLHPVAGRVHQRRKTPWVGVLVSALLTLILVFTGGLKILAQTTSLLVLVVFLLVHSSLIRVKLKSKTHTGFRIPYLFPILGCLLCLLLLFRFPAMAYLRSLMVIVIGLILWCQCQYSARSCNFIRIK